MDDAEGDCIVDERSEKVSFRFRKNVGDHLWETVEMKGLSREDKAEIRKKAIELTQERHKQSQTDKESKFKKTNSSKLAIKILKCKSFFLIRTKIRPEADNSS